MSLLSRSAALLATVTMTGGLLAPASAVQQRGEDPGARKQQVDRQVAGLRHDLQESTAAMRGAVAAYDEATSQLPAAREAVAQARGALAAAQVRAAAARDALSSARSAERVASRRVGAAYDAVSSTQLTVGNVARLAYQQGPMAGLAVALEARTPEDFSSQLASVQTVLERENASLDQLRSKRANLALLEAQLEAARQRAGARRTEAADQLLSTQQAEQAAESAQQRVAALAAARASAVQAAEAARATDRHRYQVMQAEQDRLAQLIRARAAAAAKRAAERAARAEAARAAAARAAAARAAGARASRQHQHAAPRHHRAAAPSRLFAYPVFGPITSPFGYRYHPVLHYRKLHTGVDFGVAEGTPVHASRGGRVIEADFNVAYGYRIVIDHGYVNGQYLATTYNHQSRVAVSVGQYVSQNQVIGYSGNTGWSTGPHLHFEVLVNGGFVDPMAWL